MHDDAPGDQAEATAAIAETACYFPKASFKITRGRYWTLAVELTITVFNQRMHNGLAKIVKTAYRHELSVN